MIQNQTFIQLIQEPDVQAFIEKNRNHPHPEQLALQWSGKVSFNLKLVTQQLELWQKHRNKLPMWAQHQCVFTSKAAQQATDEQVAQWKKKYIVDASFEDSNQVNASFIDLTAGLGIDAYYLSQGFGKVVLLDANEVHVEQLRYNWFERLKVEQQRVEIRHESAETYWNTASKAVFDLVYIDPDRRPSSLMQRVVSLEDSEPNVLTLLPMLLKQSRYIYIKVSPMHDVVLALRQLQGASHVWAIALDNELKELLFELTPHTHGTPTHCIIHAVNLRSKDQSFSLFSQNLDWKHGNTDTFTNTFATEARYFYEPNTALIKTHLVKAYANALKLDLIHSQSAYLLSNEWVADFAGRVFEIQKQMPYKPNTLKQWLKQHNIQQANIAKRHFFWEVDQLRKELRLKEGGDTYLFFTQSLDNHAWVYCCKKVER